LLPLRVAEIEVESLKMASHTEPLPSLPLRVAQTEVDSSKAMEHEAAQTEVEQTKVTEPEAHMLETGPFVAVDIAEESIPALHQANTDGSPSTVKLSSCTIDEQGSETMAAPGEESSPSQTDVTQVEVVEPLVVIEHGASHTRAEMEVEQPEVIDHEACVPQACSVSAAMDNSKENIPALHQSIQPSGAPSPLKGNILASNENIQAEVAVTPAKGNISSSHLSMQAIGEMTPVTLLTQKLSTISLGAANGDATPLTLLAQKLSSISLGDATE